MSALFTPFNLGSTTIANRIGMSALTRNRSSDTVPNEIMREYYFQRATGGAGLIVLNEALITLPSVAVSMAAIVVQDLCKGLRAFDKNYKEILPRDFWPNAISLPVQKAFGGNFTSPQFGPMFVPRDRESESLSPTTMAATKRCPISGSDPLSTARDPPPPPPTKYLDPNQTNKPLAIRSAQARRVVDCFNFAKSSQFLGGPLPLPPCTPVNVHKASTTSYYRRTIYSYGKTMLPVPSSAGTSRADGSLIELKCLQCGKMFKQGANAASVESHMRSSACKGERMSNKEAMRPSWRVICAAALVKERECTAAPAAATTATTPINSSTPSPSTATPDDHDTTTPIARRPQTARFMPPKFTQ
ncbi:hypothetical protein B0H11DRAFT_2183232 [Mycena galericulata]|nr:hypothetical protein B0H11DRAFT_2183232 [Mycena galericulata]